MPTRAALRKVPRHSDIEALRKAFGGGSRSGSGDTLPWAAAGCGDTYSLSKCVAALIGDMGNCLATTGVATQHLLQSDKYCVVVELDANDKSIVQGRTFCRNIP